MTRLVLGLLCTFLIFGQPQYGHAQNESPAKQRTIQILFLGDNGHHRPADRAEQLIPVMRNRGIEIRYSDDAGQLNPQALEPFDGLLIYANIARIQPEQEEALLDFVSGGKGLIPIHCATACFHNSSRYVDLVGGQFRRHGAGIFGTEIADPDHPIMQGFSGFESWDESYIHHRHNEKDRIVLSYRTTKPQEQGREKEPWTWIRTHGKGRVFYTAWGHDNRTWGHPGFQNLVERGIRWAVGADPADAPEYDDSQYPNRSFPVPQMTAERTDVEPFEYEKADIAFYPPGGPRRGDGEWNQMQLPLSPDQSMKHFVTPVGFRVELFAAEPDIGKPICMNWDERGRLWVAETVDYPNNKQPEGAGNDRIRICEDTDGDGRADRFTIFAEGLSIPTSLTFSNGGVIVLQPPQTLFLKDTDGDDKADVQKVLFEGWSTADTHAGPSNLQYGLDNWIWGILGYAGFDGEVGGQHYQFNKGFFRFRPDASDIEFVRSTNNNSWGLGFSEEGLVFGSTANRNPSVYMPIPNRYYERVRGWSAAQLGGIADTYLFKPITNMIRQVDQHGGYTAAAGHALYTARTYPQEYWNRTAFVTGPTGHLVGTFVLNRDGADFSSKSPFNLLASDDEWSAPIMAEVGPDGNVWVIDWYNYIVQHNPTPVGYKTGKGNAYETPLRDKRHGRVYRVIYDANSSQESYSLKDATPSQLVATLKHENMFWRKHAQRLLVERQESDVIPDLMELVSDGTADSIGLNVGAIHALWTMHGLGALDGSRREATAAAYSALRHRSAGVRRNAALVLPHTVESAKAILDAHLLEDPDAQVRLAALLTLADTPANVEAARSIAQFFAAFARTSDPWQIDAATSAAAKQGTHFLSAVIANGEVVPHGELQETVAIVAEHIARSRETAGLNQLLAALSQSESILAGRVITGLARGWNSATSFELSSATEQSLVQTFERLQPADQGRLVRLAGVWGTRQFEHHARDIIATLFGTIRDSTLDEMTRISAAEQLVAFRESDDEIVEKLLTLLTPQESPNFSAGVIQSLQQSTAASTGPLLISRMREISPAARSAAIRVLLARPVSTSAFLKAVADGHATMSELSLDQKQALSVHPDLPIRRAAIALLRKGDSLPNPDRQRVLGELSHLADQQGDVALGHEVYKKQCAKCHKHSGEGTKIGPDLTGMAVHPKAELLMHLIDPSRNVEGTYRVYTVVLDDGRVLNGMLGGETSTTFELIDAEAKRIVIQREDVEQLVASEKSLMPEGFEKQVPPADIVNLLEFLTRRGQYLPLDLKNAATIVSTSGMFHNADSPIERLIFNDWGPKSFEGVPFQLVDPEGGRRANVIMLYGPRGLFPPRMPRSVSLDVNGPAKSIHLLSGIAGWAAQQPQQNPTLSMTVRIHYADGTTEDHPLLNGRHFADYISRFDVPDSKFAFALRRQQVRYLSITPRRPDVIHRIEFVKGPDHTAPIVMAVTVESGP